jgi:hypothetical protein
VQAIGEPGWQIPATHRSPCVQVLPSVQEDPSAIGGFEQSPVAGSHAPTTWHWSSAVQIRGVPAVQRPDLQTSPLVQELPSLHGVRSATGGFEHVPVDGLQIPTAWHWSAGPAHCWGVPGVHTPAVQVSPLVHAFPSLHAVPLLASGFEHTPVAGLQTPTAWH